MRTIDHPERSAAAARSRAACLAAEGASPGRAAVRATLLAAVLALLTALAVPGALAAPARDAATVTTVRIKVVNGRPQGGIKRPTVKKGATVRFVVVSNKGEELHLHGYDVEKTMRPPKPTVIQVVAKISGRFELEMHHPDVLLAQLTVKP